MHVDPQRYRSFERRTRVKIAIYVAIGGLIALFAGFWLLVGGVGVFAPELSEDRPIAVLLIVFGGLIPGLFSVAAFVMVGLEVRKRSRVERLALLVRKHPMATADELASRLGLRLEATERLLFDACAAGVLLEESVPQQPRETRDTIEDGALAALEAEGAAAAARPPASGVRRKEAPPASFAEAPTALAGAPGAGIESNDPLAAWIQSPVATLTGVVLNDTYQIEEQLGEGGMGSVYVGRHLRTGRRYAVKVLLPGTRYSSEAIKRFEREAAAASALGHPGIVQVHDFDVTEEGMHYLVFELLHGETLERRLQARGSLPWSEAAEMVMQVGEALDAAHEAGVVHRDLKPANIFLDTRGDGTERAVLLDFGLAKPIGDVAVTKITTTGTVVGTPLYMSPEQACSERLDRRSDVYALGAVLFELLTGAPPFLSDTIAGVYAKLLNERAARPSQSASHPVPGDIDDLMERALAKNPDERFQTARALVVALGEIRRRHPTYEGRALHAVS